MKEGKIEKMDNENALEDKSIDYLRNVIGDKFEKEGLSKEVLKLSHYLDKYIASKQNQQKKG